MPRQIREFPRAAKGWWEIKEPKALTVAGRPSDAHASATSPTVTEIWIYDVIGDSWFGDSISARRLCRAISEIKTDQILLHFSSPGGNCGDGIAIANALRAHPAETIAVIESYTASIATVMAAACDTVRVWDNSLEVIHLPWTCGCFNRLDFDEYKDWLEKIEAGMLTTYMLRCTKSVAELVAALEAESVLSPEELIEWGLADEIITGQQAAAYAPRDPHALLALGMANEDIVARVAAAVGPGAGADWTATDPATGEVIASGSLVPASASEDGMPDPEECPCHDCTHDSCMRTADGEPGDGMPEASACPCHTCTDLTCCRANSTQDSTTPAADTPRTIGSEVAALL